MFLTGDVVEQTIDTRVVKKGTIGVIKQTFMSYKVGISFHEVEFQLQGATVLKLRYETELKMATLPTSTQPTTASQKFKIGDKVEVSCPGHFYNGKIGIIKTIPSPGIYMVEFNAFSTYRFLDCELKIAQSSTSTNSVNNTTLNTMSGIKAKCTCQLHGPNGLLAKGCQCGGA